MKAVPAVLRRSGERRERNAKMLQDLNQIHASLNQLFEQRDRLFPKRDRNNTTLMVETLTAYVDTLKKNQDPDWEPDNRLMEPIKDIAGNGLFICGNMKSGTSLLIELLDGHPELIVMPGDSHMINLINDHRGMTYQERLRTWDAYWISRLVNPTGQKPFWILGESESPYSTFIQYLNCWLSILPDVDHSPFMAAVFAFHCSNPGRASKPKWWVEKTPENERKVKQILAYVPNARFIQIVRDPRPTMASLKRLYQLRGWRWDAAVVASSIRKNIKAGLLNQKRLGIRRYHILRYEELVTNTEDEMKKVASFLDISMDNTLLHPTVNHQPAKSNSMYIERQGRGEIIKSPVGNWHKELEDDDQKMILALLHSVGNKVGYDCDTARLSIYVSRLRYILFRIIQLLRK
jgi:hypothetical protein